MHFTEAQVLAGAKALFMFERTDPAESKALHELDWERLLSANEADPMHSYLNDLKFEVRYILKAIGWLPTCQFYVSFVDGECGMPADIELNTRKGLRWICSKHERVLNEQNARSRVNSKQS